MDEFSLCPISHLLNLPDKEPAKSKGDQSLTTQSGLSRDSVSQYLQLRPDQSVLILHAKVAQKSYGNEKRFFCPPPCVYLSGLGWKLRQDHLKASGFGDSSCRVCGYMGLDNTGSAQVDTFKLTFEDQPGGKRFACAKALYISDADKRKHFRLVLKLFFSNGQEIGSFYSRLIKVISKPSQKKQSMKNADRSKVSLFNRLRSQTVSTRYLAVEGGAFVASARQWAAFTVTLVDEQQTEQGEYSLREGYVCYGCVLQLICTVTGVALPPMADPCQKDPGRELLNDGSCWTIIGTETVEYTFSESLACLQTAVTPIPVISTLELNGGGHVAMLEIHGESFGPHLKVWFGNVEAETMFRTPKSMLCVVPDVSVFSGEWRWLRRPITVPLSLIRLDGLIYSSNFTFTYTPEHTPPAQPTAAPECPADSDSLIDSIHQEFTRTNFHLFMQS
ncbi:hypothetical protein AAFF_G00144070 [Aldrovandia affinis]|uniref:Recombining binding protein suppressor of hairless-like protein n=1 Tax=Aldrovandia affinis TaxID=143900 RepID=A0AAD7WX10_9TELE|nr:hypothetical protein AAFF_G00144070 [Aldrovandia affinis]